MAVVVVAALALALAKPWGSTPAATLVLASPLDAAVGQAEASLRTIVVPTEPPPAWPAEATTTPQSVGAATIAGAAKLLVERAGSWGFGAGGSGPRLIRDQVWADWVAATPRPVATRSEPETPTADRLCAGLPTLVDQPSVIAVTTPARSSPATWQLVGWWTDGGPPISLDRSVRSVPLPDAPGTTILERVDQATWPSGQYEFRLSTGPSTVSLAVCLDAGR